MSMIKALIYLQFWEKPGMENFKNLILDEEKRLKTLIENSEKVFSSEKQIREKIAQEIKRLRNEKLETLDFNEKNKIEEEIKKLQIKSSRYIFQDPAVLRSPYFGILELLDTKLGKLAYKIGKKTIFGENGNVSVIDWREAPVSRLFYEYESDEDYDEDIRGQERTGQIKLKRRVGIKNRELRSISEKNKTLITVSYTHLTLPTILLVQISVVAVSLKKKTLQDKDSR
eukprot:TRINITY_DN3455_c0_g1_i1.p2 TRINITY_DN3455_c0_g1~~TRINITY_DN3455_c0_g1_i1.p2  ORF type:complete len:228 (-),score=62.46 TRINITY_DN3455_c0_g1_i1:75-758(-)